MAKVDFEQSLGKQPGQQLDQLGKLAKAIERQAAIKAIIDLKADGMPVEVASDLLCGVAEGRESEVLETLARVGQKFIR